MKIKGPKCHNSDPQQPNTYVNNFFLITETLVPYLSPKQPQKYFRKNPSVSHLPNQKLKSNKLIRIFRECEKDSR